MSPKAQAKPHAKAKTKAQTKLRSSAGNFTNTTEALRALQRHFSQPAGTRSSHVHFVLKDGSDEDVQALIDAAKALNPKLIIQRATLEDVEKAGVPALEEAPQSL